MRPRVGGRAPAEFGLNHLRKFSHVYGYSCRSLHGDPKTAQRDQLIRGMLELDGYSVIVVRSRDLDDPQAVRLHLKNIARAIGLNDLIG